MTSESVSGRKVAGHAPRTAGLSASERLAEADRILNLPTAREYVAAMLLELADTRTKTAILVDAVEQSWTHPPPSVRAACKRAREAAEGNRVTAGTGVDIDQRTEWAIWFDADDPNDPNAVIFGKDDEAEARDALLGWESYSDPDDLDQPSGACSRTVTTLTSPWSPASPWTAGKP